MPVVLKGGCRVSSMREGTAEAWGTLSMWRQVGRASGAQSISLRLMEFAPGLSPGLRAENCDEVLYALEATTEPTIFIGGWPYSVAPATGIYIQPGETFTVANPGPDPVVFLSSQCPEPEDSFLPIAPQTSPSLEAMQPQRPPLVRLEDRGAIPTGNRWYRILVDEEIGSNRVTQFVGSIPPGRAPDHFHDYEEVLFILEGTGKMWAAEMNTPIRTGSCIYLPRRQVHCVENTGSSELRLLGVFYPAGCPSVSYEAT